MILTGISNIRQNKKSRLLDVGWGGDLKILRGTSSEHFSEHPVRPVNLNNYAEEELEATITRLVERFQ